MEIKKCANLIVVYIYFFEQTHCCFIKVLCKSLQSKNKQNSDFFHVYTYKAQNTTTIETQI